MFNNQSPQTHLHVFIALWLLMALMATPCTWAGTFRDDFENEKDFLNDKQLRDGGVWGEDIAFYTWEKGTIKGINVGDNVWGLITGDYSWEDYTVECKVKPLQNNGYVGLYLRRPCIDCLPCYVFALSVRDGAAIYLDFWQKLNSSPFEAQKNTWHSLKAVVQGDSLEFYIDNKLVAKAKDKTRTAGKAGFIIDNGEVLFDDFVMTGPKVKDGGHWNPKAHPQQQPVEPQRKLTTTWGNMKRGR